MTNWVPPEINRAKGGLLLVGRDPGTEEMSAGRPFVGQSGRLLNDALTAAGIRRQDVNIANVVGRQPPGNAFAAHNRADVLRGRAELDRLVHRLSPSCIVALGNEAAFSLIPGWPSKDGSVYTASGINDRRGYIWEGFGGFKVVTALHPAGCLPYRDPSGISGMLLVRDLERAKREAAFPEIHRKNYNIHVVTNEAEAQEAYNALHGRVVAADIECPAPAKVLACVGFAASTEEAYVFGSATFEVALELMQDASTTKVFQNGQFDTYFLRTRHGCDVASWLHDTMVAWHAVMPEIAGKGESGSKKTQKSLAFMASMFAESPQWWKNYDEWESEADMYRLNGIDCCVTLECHQSLQQEIAELGVEAIYRHEMKMMPALVAIQERGLLVADKLRKERMVLLSEKQAVVVAEMNAAVRSLLEERRERLAKPHLFFGSKQCECCGGGKKKAKACWSCAGFEKAPSLKELRTRMNGSGHSMKKAELEASVLSPCLVCGGVGGFNTFDFNPNSNDQMVDVLYNVLKVPPRYNDGKLTVDEAALKNSLGSLH